MLSDKRTFDIELVEVGNMITVDLYLGVIKKGNVKIKDKTIVDPAIINRCLRHLTTDDRIFADSKLKERKLFESIIIIKVTFRSFTLNRVET